jgi:hypothetical protein
VCTHHGVFVGPCFTIHGRMYAANGSPSYRIWIVGSNRIFGVHEGIGETACRGGFRKRSWRVSASAEATNTASCHPPVESRS